MVAYFISLKRFYAKGRWLMHCKTGHEEIDLGFFADYVDRIKRLLKKKRIKLFKRALLDGQKNAQSACQGFIEKLNTLNYLVRNAKVDCLIRNADRLVKIHIEKNPKTLIPMVLKLLNNIAEHADVELAAHKDDVAAIKNSVNEIIMACAYTRKINIIEDDTLNRGSMVIKANKSIIDAQLKTQLSSAKQILLNHLPSQ
jgi:flagellar biosynthesis/type III secretory pathway protein FliH